MYIIFLLKGPDLRSLIYHYDLFVSIDRRLANRSHLVLKFVQFFISVYRVSKLTIWPFNNVSSCSTHLLLKKVHKAQNLHVNNLCWIRSVILFQQKKKKCYTVVWPSWILDDSLLPRGIDIGNIWWRPRDTFNPLFKPLKYCFYCKCV